MIEGMVAEMYYKLKGMPEINEAVSWLGLYHYRPGEDYLGDSSFEETDCFYFTDEATDSEMIDIDCLRIGASKIVYVVSSDFVFKTSFDGYAIPREELEWDRLSAITKESLKLSDDGKWAFKKNSIPDFSKLEYIIYKLACKERLDSFFAETQPVDKRVYMQEGCETIFSEDRRVSEAARMLEDKISHDPLTFRSFPLEFFENPHDKELAQQMREWVFRFELGFLKDELSSKGFLTMLAFYPISELQRLNRFLRKYSINDLHDGNLGWFDDKLKFIDFCGYNFQTAKLLKDMEVLEGVSN